MQDERLARPDPDLPARAIEVLQLIGVGAVRTVRSVKPHGLLIEFELEFPTLLWPQYKWGDLARYIVGAGRNRLISMSWSWEVQACTLALTDQGKTRLTGTMPLFLLQPENGEHGWRANAVIKLEPWRLREGNVVHGERRFQIGRIAYDAGSCTVWAAHDDHREVYAADADVPVETSSLLPAQHPAPSEV